MSERDAKEGLNELTPLIVGTLAEVHDSFLAFLRRRLGNTADAEEVMQEFYLRVIAHASQLRNEESARAWLRRILGSVLVDHGRRAAASRRTEADFARKEAAMPPSTEELEGLVCRCLYRLLPLLRPEYSELIRRVDLENEPRVDVAAVLGVTVGNLTVRLHRARQTLRRALQLTCETCPIHGYLDCGCKYSRRLRSGDRRRRTIAVSDRV